MAKRLIKPAHTGERDTSKVRRIPHGHPRRAFPRAFPLGDASHWPDVPPKSPPMPTQTQMALPPMAPARAVATTFHAAPLSLTTPAPTEATALIDGGVHYFPVASGQTLLEAAHQAGLDLPGSCAVACDGTCRCTLAGGSVELAVDPGLSDARLTDALLLGDGRVAREILPCVAKPTSAWVILAFD